MLALICALLEIDAKTGLYIKHSKALCLKTNIKQKAWASNMKWLTVLFECHDVYPGHDDHLLLAVSL